MTESSTTLDLDLRMMLLDLWRGRWSLLAGALVGFLLAAGYAFLVAKPVYESSTLLVPTEQSKDDQLGAASALLGKRGSALGDVALYQSLLTSRRVVHKLLVSHFRNEEDSAKGRLEPLYQILHVDTSMRGDVAQALKGLTSKIVVEPKLASDGSSGGGIIQVTVSASTAWLAQQIGDKVVDIGQEELRTIRNERSRTIGVRLEVATNLARGEWDAAATKLTAFKAQNRSIVLPEQMLEQTRLELEKQTKEQKYLLARKELETLELEVAKAAPPMLVLDSADLPAKPVRPKRMMMLAVGLIVGLFASGAWLLGRSALGPLFAADFESRDGKR